MDSQDNKRKWKNRDLISSLEFALTGILLPSGRTQYAKTCSDGSCSHSCRFCFQVSRIEWLFLLLSIFLVVALRLSILLSKMWWIWPVTITFPCWLKCQGYGSWRGISSLFFCLNRLIDFSPTNLGFIILNSKRKL